MSSAGGGTAALQLSYIHRRLRYAHSLPICNSILITSIGVFTHSLMSSAGHGRTPTRTDLKLILHPRHRSLRSLTPYLQLITSIGVFTHSPGRNLKLTLHPPPPQSLWLLSEPTNEMWRIRQILIAASLPSVAIIGEGVIRAK